MALSHWTDERPSVRGGARPGGRRPEREVIVDEEVAGMSWTWRYETDDGGPASASGTNTSEPFPTQGDAESWLGEIWRDLLEAGVSQVVLLDAGRKVYGPMSLRPVD
jgi:hypothetical protein